MGAKLISILLSSFILVQSISFHVDDICKIGELIEHYNYHADNYGDNIYTFFSKHYGELKENHHENHQKEEHNQLPFDQKYNISYASVLILHKVKIVEIKKLLHNTSTNFYYLENYTSLERFDIFQPPKIS